MNDSFIGDQSFGIWLIVLASYFLASLLSHFTISRRWAEGRNPLVGFISIMSGRSDQTWRFANRNFFRGLFFISLISFLIHFILFSITLNPIRALHNSRIFFGGSFILLSIAIEILLFVKFNWKGEKRSYKANSAPS